MTKPTKTATIQFFHKNIWVGCDGNCNKAWGINSRPRNQLSEDEDDYEYLSDNELGDAPEDPGIYEGCYGKPHNSDKFPNKWCVRECERCDMNDYKEKLSITDFSKRVRNILE